MVRVLVIAFIYINVCYLVVLNYHRVLLILATRQESHVSEHAHLIRVLPQGLLVYPLCLVVHRHRRPLASDVHLDSHASHV